MKQRGSREEIIWGSWEIAASPTCSTLHWKPHTHSKSQILQCQNVRMATSKGPKKKAAFFFLCKTYTLSWYCIFKSRKINFDPITQTDGLIGETIDCYNDIKTDFLGSISRQRAVPQHIWTFQPRNLFASWAVTGSTLLLLKGFMAAVATVEVHSCSNPTYTKGQWKDK